jgi:hypothetical protein
MDEKAIGSSAIARALSNMTDGHNRRAVPKRSGSSGERSESNKCPSLMRLIVIRGERRYSNNIEDNYLLI